MLLRLTVALVTLSVLYSCSSADISPNINLLWSFKTGYAITGGVVLHSGRVYVGSDRFYCLDAKTGSPIWQYSTPANVASSAVTDGRHVYFLCGGVHCLEAERGSPVWEFWTTDWGEGPSPFLNSGHLFVPINNNLFCLDAANGRRVWKFTAKNSGLECAVSEGHIFLGCYDTLYCLDAASGTMRWSREVANSQRLHPVAAGGSVWVGTTEKTLHCFNGAAGEEIWSRTFEHPFLSSLVVEDDRLYACTGSTVCLNASTGATIWSKTFALPVGLAPPVLHKGTLYVFACQNPWEKKVNIYNEWMYALNAADGSLLWKASVPRGKISPSENSLFISSIDFRLYCVRPPAIQKSAALSR